MAYTPVNPEAGVQPIAVTSTTQNHPLGTRVRAYDPTFGEGEFIYLAGVASTVVGSTVTFNQVTGATTLSPNTSKLGEPIAVAMSANTATTSWGWYQIAGAAVIKKTAVKVSPGVQLYQSGTAGRLMSTVATSKQIMNMYTINAATVASA